jgi:hypothetical protein
VDQINGSIVEEYRGWEDGDPLQRTGEERPEEAAEGRHRADRKESTMQRECAAWIYFYKATESMSAPDNNRTGARLLLLPPRSATWIWR